MIIRSAPADQRDFFSALLQCLSQITQMMGGGSDEARTRDLVEQEDLPIFRRMDFGPASVTGRRKAGNWHSGKQESALVARFNQEGTIEF